jgi:hypothetical protein
VIQECDDFSYNLNVPLPGVFVLQRNGTQDSVTFKIPAGYGPAADVFVMVDGVPSPFATYTYDPPVITNLAPDRKCWRLRLRTNYIAR